MTRFEGRPVDWATKPQPVEESRWRFPLVSELPEGDLVSVGGDLQPSTVVNAYRRGMFPMEVTGLPGVLGWWSPDPRGILPLDRLRVTRSMRQSAKRYDIRVDTCFEPNRSEEHTSELQSQFHLVCRLLLEKKKMIEGAEFDVELDDKTKKKKQR